MKHLMMLVISLGLVGCGSSSGGDSDSAAGGGGGGGGGDSNGDTDPCVNIAYTHTPNTLAELKDDVNTLLTNNPTADLNSIDTSQITKMTNIFNGNSTFNGDISCWNTSKVTSMQNMFVEATVFNGDISGWKTSEVTNMNNMFYAATVFNQDLSGWDVSKVTNRVDFATDSGFEALTNKHPDFK